MYQLKNAVEIENEMTLLWTQQYNNKPGTSYGFVR